jgi:hypothetical protein
VWFNPIIKWLLLSPLHNLVSKNMMLITYAGLKSGKVYMIPVNYIRNGDVLTTTSQKNRAWWRNLRGGAEVTLRVQGKDMKASVQVTEDDESVAKVLFVIFQDTPQLARYYNVGLTTQGQPIPEDVNKAAQKSVIITSTLSH